jgi:hypothetical protein
MTDLLIAQFFEHPSQNIAPTERRSLRKTSAFHFPPRPRKRRRSLRRVLVRATPHDVRRLSQPPFDEPFRAHREATIIARESSVCADPRSEATSQSMRVRKHRVPFRRPYTFCLCSCVRRPVSFGVR